MAEQPNTSIADKTALKLYHWLIRMARDGDGRVSLGHLSVSGPGVALGQWAVRHEDAPDAIRELAQSIVRAAADDADGQAGGTPQQYVTLFYNSSAPDTAASRLPFRLASLEQFAPEGSALATEPPTATGMVAQAIRHNEFLVKASFGAMGSACTNLERQNAMMAEQLMRQTEQIFQMQQERQDLLDRDAERLLKIEQFEADRDHRDRMTSEGISLLKGLIASAANGGKPLMLPVSTSPSPAAPASGQALATVSASAPSEAEAGESGAGVVRAEGLVEAPGQQTVPAAALVALGQLQEFFRSLTPEQTMQINGLLTPMQQGSLFTLYQLFAGLSDEEKAAAGVVDP